MRNQALWHDLMVNIQAAKYFTQIPYEWAPATPKVLQKTAAQLTREEFESVPSLQKEWEESVKAYQERIEKRLADIRRLRAEFERDLCASFDMNPRHPFTKLTLALATRHFDDHQLQDIAFEFEELAALWDLRKAIPEEEDFRTYE